MTAYNPRTGPIGDGSRPSEGSHADDPDRHFERERVREREER